MKVEIVIKILFVFRYLYWISIDWKFSSKENVRVIFITDWTQIYEHWYRFFDHEIPPSFCSKSYRLVFEVLICNYFCIGVEFQSSVWFILSIWIASITQLGNRIGSVKANLLSMARNSRHHYNWWVQMDNDILKFNKCCLYFGTH